MKTFWTPVLLLSLGCSDQAFGPQGATEPIGGTGGASTTDGDSPLAEPTAGASGATNIAGAASMSALVLAEADLPPAQLEKPYLHQLTVRPEASNVTFELATGALPKGLTLSPTGELAGTPTEEGEFTVGVQVKSADASGSKEYHFRVIRRSWLVYRSDDRTPAVNELFAVNVGAGEPYTPVVLNHELAGGEQVNSSGGMWSPDGSFITYSTEGAAGGDVYFVDMRGLTATAPVSLKNALPELNLTELPLLRWAPDGRGFLVRHGSKWSLVEIHDDLKMSATPLGDWRRAFWSPDGQTVAYEASNGPNQTAIFLRPRTGDSVISEMITGEPMSIGDFTPDGQKLWMEGNSGDLLFALIDRAFPAAVPVRRPSKEYSPLYAGPWSNQFLYYVTHYTELDQYEMYRVRFGDTAQPEALVLGLEGDVTQRDYRDLDLGVLGQDELITYKTGEREATTIRQHVRVLSSGEEQDWPASANSYISSSPDGRLVLVPELRTGELLTRCAVTSGGINECYSLNRPTASFRISEHLFAPDASGALFVGADQGASAKAYYADLRGDVREGALLHEAGAVLGRLYRPFSPDSKHIALQLKDGNTTSVVVVDVSAQTPSAPIRVSGEGIVSTVAWQPR